MSSARNRAAIEPANVVAVPQSAAVRRVVVPLPYSEATPLKLALAPLVKATKQTARSKITTSMGLTWACVPSSRPGAA